MREIKFRAWNTSNGMKYMDSDFFIGADGTIYDRASRTHDTPNLEIESVSSMILMQFTGLKDKKGLTDIYEGDIIDQNGGIRGNIYEITEDKIHKSGELDGSGTNLIVANMGSRAWRDSEQALLERGCQYSE